ncbi:MAG: tRNA uridine-5-carboxymethylaminomethyl(34) synthesis enzyme MnmG [Bdellovibrionales bacterium RIFOXYB1_FULL_37_110]|nr:MAG: tRNA uridine-5-carboxymethylaminomethyl(34) synthesis enzyme MnmG [Bdellovibrionales bacterium RIFOXYA1_FULL_38_20]OFZ50365.1 MAG: tRNA uridine-5-carboxymethylaminomethyl(34) synthesis enzyme MnmG [Bdellovibrionales bacterium RIFOXYC1_FULL_37_79]OFZ60974.1 MAG: tRNA uridine-5-carboxymethylaminomethyl(34) synthesis enzyme MnmG [Bdellovibrionales bacterium RIFOXYB1_FULL_37_110]OFZ63718.1 MAG: tRNA uridine-5-carboxymethylaminomethyl(34) synthesis enzyme MnmG [Bdellovibrionales bacterium RIF
MEKSTFDIVVVGAGHAGIEAAWMVGNIGLKVALINLPGVQIAETPCNPAIGGVGKGQLVREIDAMGGLMGKITDLSAIHYKVLNESKGYAVQSTRVQVDKERYSVFAEKFLRENKNISIISAKVVKINYIAADCFEIRLENNDLISSKAAIVCTGTFLNGKLHIGAEQIPGGVFGCDRSDSLISICPVIEASKRFKTGTPARICKSSINWSKLEKQNSEPTAQNFHILHNDFERFNQQITCYLTRTNQRTMEIIRRNRNIAPLYNGQIKGIGPRYCPSIEDKAFRYQDRNEHHIFLEMEGHELDSVYPNGISTSLPKEVQNEFIHSIVGLEDAQILKYGYAVEYDVVDPTVLNFGLGHKDFHGLYFAGQINGTSGYEEAAAQGVISGINASLKILNKAPIIFSRNDCYLGVLIEDIITNDRDEPYRLFTARAENRLFIREDNTINRMHCYREKLGLHQDIDQFQNNYINYFNLLEEFAESYFFKSNDLIMHKFNNNGYGVIDARLSLSELLKRAHLDPVKTLSQEISDQLVKIDYKIIKSVAISQKYRGYITKANNEFENLNKLDALKINWKLIAENERISNECRQRIIKTKPESFSQLRRINGIRPATIAYVATMYN